MQDDPKTLVSTEWLHAHLKDPDLRILDGSYYLPQMGRDPRAEYDSAHIPNARFFDIDDVADHGSDLPHMVPPISASAAFNGVCGPITCLHAILIDNAQFFNHTNELLSHRVG